MNPRHRAKVSKPRTRSAQAATATQSLKITPESARGKLNGPLLAKAIRQWAALDLAGREKVMDAVHADHKDLLLSVLALMHQGHRADSVNMLLQILGVAHLAAAKGGHKMTAVSENQVILELERVTAQIKFTHDLTVDQRDVVLRQYLDNQGEHWLAAYMLETLRQSDLLSAAEGDERDQVIVLMAYTLLGCVARALNGPPRA